VKLSPELREAVELDEYLARVGASLATKRILWKRQGRDDAAYVAAALRARVVEARVVYKQELLREAQSIPIVRAVLSIPYIGALRFLRFAIYVDIEKADTVAALWRFCGLGVGPKKAIDRYAALRNPGVRFNPRAARALLPFRPALARHPQYRAAYDQYAARQIANGLSQRHALVRAARYQMKLFLKHLWLVWRRIEGLPVGIGYPGDTTHFASEFGWRYTG
jgi:hypothetical protein